MRRSLRFTGTRTEQAIAALRAMCDLPMSVQAFAREPFLAKLGWLVPPLIQGVSYLVVLGLIVADRMLGAACFALLAAVIYHHYDVVYRIRANAGQPPRWLSIALGGNLGRAVLVVLLATTFTAGRTLSTVIWALTGYLALVALGESVRFWTRPAAPVLPD